MSGEVQAKEYKRIVKIIPHDRTFHRKIMARMMVLAFVCLGICIWVLLPFFETERFSEMPLFEFNLRFFIFFLSLFFCGVLLLTIFYIFLSSVNIEHHQRLANSLYSKVVRRNVVTDIANRANIVRMFEETAIFVLIEAPKIMLCRQVIEHPKLGESSYFVFENIEHLIERFDLKAIMKGELLSVFLLALVSGILPLFLGYGRLKMISLPAFLSLLVAGSFLSYLLYRESPVARSNVLMSLILSIVFMGLASAYNTSISLPIQFAYTAFVCVGIVGLIVAILNVKSSEFAIQDLKQKLSRDSD